MNRLPRTAAFSGSSIAHEPLSTSVDPNPIDFGSVMAASNFSDMTVTVLKAELRDRGLPVSGNKGELVKRLEEHEAAARQPDADTAAVSNAADPPARAADPPEAPGDSVDAQPAAEEPGAAGANGEQPSTVQDATEKRIARFGQTVLKDEEKARKREERFKTVDPLADGSKIESRAARFGILTEAALKDKQAARAKRFNVDTPELMEEKKKARDARFAAPDPTGPKETHTVNEIAAMIHKKS